MGERQPQRTERAENPTAAEQPASSPAPLLPAQVLTSEVFKSISVTAEGWLRLEEVKPASLVGWLRSKKRQGFTVVGLEQTAMSSPLAGPGSTPLPPRTVLLLGKEKEGIPAALLAEVDRCVEIPQLGIVRSLNVHVSASIAVWEFTRQQRLLRRPSSEKPVV